MLSIPCNNCVKSFKSRKITRIKPLINKYNCEAISYPSPKNEWKKIVKNRLTNVLCAKKVKIIPSLFFKK